MTGQRIGGLLVLERSGCVGGRPAFLCACDCGKRVVLPGSRLRAKNRISCGCRKGEHVHRTHHLSETPAYVSWQAMWERCRNPKQRAFRLYGGRGISVCDRWRSFEAFHADMGDRPEGTTLDRYPNRDGNYEPGNCRWATWLEQSNNRSDNRRLTADGETLTIAQWSRRTGVPVSAIKGRLKRGWPLDRALHEPPTRSRPRAS